MGTLSVNSKERKEGNDGRALTCGDSFALPAADAPEPVVAHEGVLAGLQAQQAQHVVCHQALSLARQRARLHERVHRPLHLDTCPLLPLAQLPHLSCITAATLAYYSCRSTLFQTVPLCNLSL